jgi:hypothetical protein
MTTAQITFRRQYSVRPLSPRPGQVTPPGQIEQAVLDIVARWNEFIPRNRCRILSDQRYVDIGSCLYTVTRDEVLAAIEFYSKQRWNRAKGAWKNFDNFFAPANVVLWYEKSQEAAERATPTVPEVRAVAASIGRPIVHPLEDASRQFDKMPVGERRLLWDEAFLQLRTELNVDPPTEAIRKRVLETIAKDVK